MNEWAEKDDADIPELSDAELAEHSVGWQLSNLIDDVNLEIARVKSITSVGQADDILKEQRVLNLELKRDKLNAQLSDHYAGPIDAHSLVPAPDTAIHAPELPAANVSAWRLKTSLTRMPGYRSQLYKFLQGEHTQGKPSPKAQQVLDAWKLSRPPGVKVIHYRMHDVLEYELETGTKKLADLKAIQAAIADLIVPE